MGSTVGTTVQGNRNATASSSGSSNSAPGWQMPVDQQTAIIAGVAGVCVIVCAGLFIAYRRRRRAEEVKGDSNNRKMIRNLRKLEKASAGTPRS